MHQTQLQKIVEKFERVGDNCRPEPFLDAAITAKGFISLAAALSDVQDESQFESFFAWFIHLLFRFYGSFQQAFDMGLFASVDEITRPSPQELRKLDRALENEHHRIACIVAVCRLAEAAACLVGIRRFPNYYFPWTQTFSLLLEDPRFAALFRDIDPSIFQNGHR